MRRLFMFGCALLLLPIVAANAQGTGRIEGTVKSTDGNAIGNAIVLIAGTTMSVRTDAQGHFLIEAIPPGTYQIEAHYFGFKAKGVAGLRVPGGQTITGFDFSLESEPSQGGLLLRFQLIKATATRNRIDPGIAGIDSLLKDLFRFPGYKLLSNAAVAVDYLAPRRGSIDAPSTDQLLNGDGKTLHLSVTVDTATAQSVRLRIWLYEPVVPVQTKNASGGVSVSSDRHTLLVTTVTLSYGRTVVLGSTQPGRSGQPGSTPETLILAVRPELRTP